MEGIYFEIIYLKEIVQHFWICGYLLSPSKNVQHSCLCTASIEEDIIHLVTRHSSSLPPERLYLLRSDWSEGDESDEAG